MPTYTSAAARISDSATKAGAAYADVQFWMIRHEHRTLWLENRGADSRGDADG
jgi:hypothetical protein